MAELIATSSSCMNCDLSSMRVGVALIGPAPKPVADVGLPLCSVADEAIIYSLSPCSASCLALYSANLNACLIVFFKLIFDFFKSL